jgi:hypothetical protein
VRPLPQLQPRAQQHGSDAFYRTDGLWLGGELAFVIRCSLTEAYRCIGWSRTQALPGRLLAALIDRLWPKAAQLGDLLRSAAISGTSDVLPT